MDSLLATCLSYYIGGINTYTRHERTGFVSPTLRPSEPIEPGRKSDAVVKDPPPVVAAPDLSLQEVLHGVSITASVDEDFNQWLWDMDSKGRIRLRKLAGNTTTWTDPEDLHLTPEPKPDSPLTAITWVKKTDRTITNVRLYYLDSTNHIIESTSACSISSPCKWSRGGTPSKMSSGGLSAFYMNEGGVAIRLYYLAANSEITALEYTGGHWKEVNTGIIASPHSYLSASAISYPDSTLITAIFVLYTAPDGSLRNMVWRRGQNDDKYYDGNPVDTDFARYAPQSAHFTILYGDPVNWAWSYYLSTRGIVERWTYTNNDDHDWQGYWAPIVGTADYPDVLGGAIASIAWNYTQSRMYYMSGDQLKEMGSSNSRWWNGPKID